VSQKENKGGEGTDGGLYKTSGPRAKSTGKAFGKYGKRLRRGRFFGTGLRG